MSDNKEQKKGHVSLTAIIFIILFLAICVGEIRSCASGGSDDDHPKTHLTAKQKAQKREKEKEKKAIKHNEKEHLVVLKKELRTLPSKSHNAITDAKMDEDDMSVVLTLNDDALDGTDAQLRKLSKEAWEIGVGIVHKNGPYEDGKIDYSEPDVYVQDSSGNELGETSAFGDFKWKGND